MELLLILIVSSALSVGSFSVMAIIGPGVPLGNPVRLSCIYTLITLCVSSVVVTRLGSIDN